MYPIMLPGTAQESDGFTSYRNPDQLFPERQGTPPDPVGRVFVKILEFFADAFDALRRPKAPREGATTPAKGDAAADPALQCQ